MKEKRSDKGASSTATGAAGGAHATPSWTPATRVVFRFAFVYLGLFCLVTQISGSMLPNLSVSFRGLGRLWPLREVTTWLAAHVFGTPLGPDEVNAGGEPFFFWVQACWVLVVSAVAALAWSALDRGRASYVRLHAWFRLFVRFALAASMFEYGTTKVIPTQFPSPPLTTLVTPVGDMTLSALLWSTIGAAPAYEIVTGCVELLGGLLLLAPQTTLLGAVISLAASAQVFLLNMTFDIGLKAVSCHLMLLALFLLAPDGPRLVDLFVRDRAVPASRHPDLAPSARGRRSALVLQLAFGAYLLAMYAFINVSFWPIGGGGRPKSALYGIWDVETLAVDGQVRPAQLNDYDRQWRRMIFDEPGAVAFQRTDDSLARYRASIDAQATRIDLRKGDSRTWNATFAVTRPSADRLALSGEMDGYRIQMQLRRVELDTLRLLNSGFRWVRPHRTGGAD